MDIQEFFITRLDVYTTIAVEIEEDQLPTQGCYILAETIVSTHHSPPEMPKTVLKMNCHPAQVARFAPPHLPTRRR